MKLIYDARWLPVDEKFDGIGRYSHELACALDALGFADITWLISDERQLKLLPPNKHLEVNEPVNILAELHLGAKLNALEPDIVYSPFMIMGNVGRTYKLVLTIHDLIYFHHRTPSLYFPWFVRIAWWLFYSAKWPLRKLLNTADVVATVSETAAAELRDWKMTKRPIVVVPNAPTGASRKNILPSHASSNDIVYMGEFTPYKNVELLIDAMAALPDCRLHLLSKIPAKRRVELEKRAREKAVQDHIIFHDGVSDEEYAELLNSARCLVTASKLEGFGLPILEAQAKGVPVACADTPIFREVAGKSALFFHTTSPTECADTLRQLGDAATSEKLIEKGYQNLERYSWKKSALQAKRICEKLTEKS